MNPITIEISYDLDDLASIIIAEKTLREEAHDLRRTIYRKAYVSIDDVIEEVE